MYLRLEKVLKGLLDFVEKHNQLVRLRDSHVKYFLQKKDKSLFSDTTDFRPQTPFKLKYKVMFNFFIR